MEISYQSEPQLSLKDFIDVLERSTLAERRPVHDKAKIQAMLDHADILLTARHGQKLVGIARSISDFSFCTYLSDLAVDELYQGQGIGKKLIKETFEKAPQAKLILLAAPKAQAYYPKIGMQQFEHCYTLSDLSDLEKA
jgi:GNAT superfamily N-acetyltransferase